ncbi:hypothetical protein [Paenibacillus polymyxa]|nr:hypothetical protein [Paenibacillus polymyxa]
MYRYFPWRSKQSAAPIPLPAPTHLKVGQAFAKKGAGSASRSVAVHLNL